MRVGLDKINFGAHNRPIIFYEVSHIMSENVSDYRQIIILRKDLGMRKGKMVAQGAHASMAAILNICEKLPDGQMVIPNDPRIMPWLLGKSKKICVYVNSGEELFSLHQAAKDVGIISSLILDSGLTEFKEPTYTAIVTGKQIGRAHV